MLNSLNQKNCLLTSSQMKVASGRYHTLLARGSSVYSCGSNLCGVLGHGSDTTQCVAFSRISLPTSSPVIHLSANHNHAAFVTRSGEVYTCGGNTSNCCGHGDINRPVFRPRLVDALEGIPCKQVAAGHNFTMFLTAEGHVYTCGTNSSGQLGHGDNVDRSTPKLVEFLKDAGAMVQISAGPTYALAVADDGTVYSFGSGTNLCLGHVEQQNSLQPHAIAKLKRSGVQIVSVSAGDEHVVALDSSGYVYTWGKGYCGALGHGDEIDKTSPELLTSLTAHLAVQVCASKRKTFVLIEDGSVYGFGWTGFGSLGFPNLRPSDKVTKPRLLDSLKGHQISQISTGLYHTVAVTRKGRIFGFGDNERAQLGHDMLRGCLEPTEIFVPETALMVVPASKC
uniref:RCC1-like domain-containing protein n=1 Tax=Kalanchoe fedtschenkoi TaxID=63787 RepID=A0A7N0RE62_KALFE